MIRFFVGLRRGPNGEARVVVRRTAAADLVSVQRVKAKDEDEAARLYVERVTGGRAAIREKAS